MGEKIAEHTTVHSSEDLCGHMMNGWEVVSADVKKKEWNLARPKLVISRDRLMQLLELAEEALYTQHTEFSNDPTDEERELMLSLYRQVGKEVPGYFARTFGWEL